MARITIYVSDELRSAMKAVDDRANWSQVAAGAFQRKLDEINRGKAITKMSEGIHARVVDGELITRRPQP